jgi:hypothetical protein
VPNEPIGEPPFDQRGKIAGGGHGRASQRLSNRRAA